jgi:hypothetical protein
LKYRKKSWNSLIDFRDYLIRTKSEIVDQFNGHTLITDQGRYGLAFGRLTFHEDIIVVKKVVAKKAAPKKAVAKKVVAKKVVAKKVVAKKTVAKKAVAKKAAPKKVVAKKAPRKKVKGIL